MQLLWLCELGSSILLSLSSFCHGQDELIFINSTKRWIVQVGPSSTDVTTLSEVAQLPELLQ